MNSTEKLFLIEQDIKLINPVLCEISDRIINEGVSKYPIFILHKNAIDIGKVILDNSTDSKKWYINMSTLEEFAVKEIIRKTKIDEFRSTYKDPMTHLCVFVLSELGANFVFFPRTNLGDDI